MTDELVEAVKAMTKEQLNTNVAKVVANKWAATDEELLATWFAANKGAKDKEAKTVIESMRQEALAAFKTKDYSNPEHMKLLKVLGVPGGDKDSYKALTMLPDTVKKDNGVDVLLQSSDDWKQTALMVGGMSAALGGGAIAANLAFKAGKKGDAAASVTSDGPAGATGDIEGEADGGAASATEVGEGYTYNQAPSSAGNLNQLD